MHLLNHQLIRTARSVYVDMATTDDFDAILQRELDARSV